MSTPATAASVARVCKAQERYAEACCKAHAVVCGLAFWSHVGPCCSDPLCGDCPVGLVTARVTADRDDLLTALRRMRLHYDTLVTASSLDEHARGVVRAYFFGVIEPADAALARAAGE
jgi:hypothetical protein